jgi:hypothetical protein
MDRDYVLYQTDRTTSVLRLIGDRVAVARAFLSPGDRFERKKGRHIATNRLRCFLAWRERSGQNTYITRHRFQDKEYTIFEIVLPENLMPEEKEMYDRVIKR